MAEKFLDKYRIKSMRLKGWDYSWDDFYFVTICTKNREHAFGKIKNGKLVETAQSKICRACWLDLPNHYPNCVLDAFVVMPDHVHGVIFIDNWRGGDGLKTAIRATGTAGAFVEAGLKPASTVRIAPAVHKKYPLSEIIRGFKTFTARKINAFQNTTGQPFWQRNYYDRIVRDEEELNRIREYIWNNPKNWEDNLNR